MVGLAQLLPVYLQPSTELNPSYSTPTQWSVVH